MSGLTLYTAGHSNRSLVDLLALLAEASVEVLVDVRRVPHSGRWPQFRRAALETALAAAGLRYVWEGEALGGKREWTEAAARHRAINDRAFAAYAAHMEGDAFRTGVERVRRIAGGAQVVLLCAERDPAHCHRSYVADYLCAFGDEVIHLVSPGERVTHELRTEARVADLRLIYDAQRQSELELA